MNKGIKVSILIIIVIAFNTACTSIQNRTALAEKIAKSADLTAFKINTDKFQLLGYGKFNSIGKPLFLFIEGDGLAYITKSRPSNNPTPLDPLSLRLAAVDGNPNVLYIARPCQYIKIESQPNCLIKYWTTSRFSEPVIEAINQAIDFGVYNSKAQRVHLVGYSGGGAVAALVAARRSDVGSLRTIAGYLDHTKLNRVKKVTPLYGSLDPMQIADSVKMIPQIHFAGTMDQIIPSWVVESFVRAADNRNCVSTANVEATHRNGWIKLWRKVGNNIPVCRN